MDAKPDSFGHAGRLSMSQVSVTYWKFTPFNPGSDGSGGTKTHYNQTLPQALRSGVIQMNDAGKITAILDPSVTVNIPGTLRPEDVYSLELINAAKAAREATSPTTPISGSVR